MEKVSPLKMTTPSLGLIEIHARPRFHPHLPSSLFSSVLLSVHVSFPLSHTHTPKHHILLHLESKLLVMQLPSKLKRDKNPRRFQDKRVGPKKREEGFPTDLKSISQAGRLSGQDSLKPQACFDWCWCGCV